MNIKTSRRGFIRTSAVLSAAIVAPKTFASSIPSTVKTKYDFKLGLASYTTRGLSLDETIAIAKKLDLHALSIKDKFHLPIDSTEEELKSGADKIRKNGIDYYGGGVFYMKTSDDVDKAFNYAKITGMKIIVGVPAPDLIKYVNQKIIDFDIKVAIHNHGPNDEVYPTSESAYKVIKNLDPRFGLCNDIGHTQRCGIDPAEDIIKFADRTLDVHLKDVTKATVDGESTIIGRGVIDIPAVIKALKQINYKDYASFEYEQDKDNPVPGLAESVGYVRGVMRSL